MTMLPAPCLRGWGKGSGASAAILKRWHADAQAETTAKQNEGLLTQWKSNHPQWHTYFKNFRDGKLSVESLTDALGQGWEQFLTPEPEKSPPLARDASRIINMVRSFQARGHLIADFEPLGLPREFPFLTKARLHELERFGPRFSLESFGFTKEEWDKPVHLKIPSRTGFLGRWELSPEERLAEWAGSYLAELPSNDEGNKVWTVRELYERLRETYCGTIGVEFIHITDTEKCNYIRDLFETPRKYSYSPEIKKKILRRTILSVMFERFAGQKFATMKRFGLDGCESLIVGLKAMTKLSTLMGVDSIVIGMAHRGRLNTLTNVMKKPAHQVFSEFHGHTTFGGYDWGNLGDVKYHTGVEYEYVDPDVGRSMLISVLPNPSHLESVNPVVLGTCRARQKVRGDTKRSKVLPVLIHGDASLAGQGVVYETLQMADPPGYAVGGTIHVVVNNQIGFTTNTHCAGSGIYCTDLAKTIGAPILHVNADDPEAVSYCMEVAVKYRQKFSADIFVDLVGYRRFGHNELDMPKFTQPKMYELIAGHPSVLEIYSKRLIDEKIVTPEEFKATCAAILNDYETAYKQSKTYKPSQTIRPFSPQWHDMASPDQVCAPRLTGLPDQTVRSIGREISTIPNNVEAHPTISRVYKARLDACEGKDNVDFGFAEALAFASLLRDGYHIRLAGQDSQRGTFSHRHAAIHDQKTGEKYFPLVDFAERNYPQCSIEIYNSTLSEFGCMGFEYGYSLENPHSLNIWEAQFGDFANGAQVIIDQYLSSGEVKWNHQSGLVLLLPHGYDGQGPEHSSGRIERFLQLCDDREDVIHPECWNVAKRSVIQKHNMQVVNCSTSANFFHVLRRQMHRGFRKPLVVFSPKKLLRLRESMSPIAAFADGTRFMRYIPDDGWARQKQQQQDSSGRDPETLVAREQCRRLVMCSGQVYYDLIKQRSAEKKNDRIMIARVEQVSPFPLDAVTDEIRSLPNLESVVWAQEEPMNQGAWDYTSKRINSVLRHCEHPNGITRVIYAGRDVAASPAVGDHKIHSDQQNQLCKDALDLNRVHNSYFEKYLGAANGL